MGFLRDTYVSLVNSAKDWFSANFSSSHKPDNLYENANQKQQDAGKASPLNTPQSKKSIKDWQDAVNMASGEKPYYIPLYSVYNNAELDLQYSAAKLKRVMHLQQTPWKVVNAKGEKDDIATSYFSKKFIRSLAKHYIDTIFWGHSLMYIYNVPNEIELVPRTNVFQHNKTFKMKYSDADDKAYKYDTPDAQRLFFEIKADENLGWLKKIAPVILFKRYANARWSAYIENYGDPFRTAKSKGANEAREKVLGEILRNMGANGYAVIRDNEELNIMPQSLGKPELFYTLMQYCDEQISKAVLTATMTMDNGSSKAQGTVHQDETKIIFDADKTEFISIVNNNVIPMLQALGIVPQGYTFEQDDKREYSTQERIDIVSLLLPKYDFTPAYIADIFDIPLADIKAVATVNSGKVPTNNAPATPNNVMQQANSCAVHEPHIHTIISMSDEELKKIFTDAATWNDKDFSSTNKELTDAITSGWNQSNITLDYDAPDHLTRALFLADIHRFGYERTAAEVYELNRLAKKSTTLKDFLSVAKPYLNGGIAHLATEYNTAKAIAQSTSRMIEFMRDKEHFPFVMYKTVGDAHVRDEHAALDGKVFDLRLGSPPMLPLGWNCRCIYVQLPSYDGNVTSREEAISILKGTMQNPDSLEKGGWLVDRLDTKQVFDDKAKYLGGISGAPGVVSLNDLSYSLQGLKDARSTMDSKTKELDLSKYSYEDAISRFNADKDDKGYVYNENIHSQPIFTHEDDFKNLVNDGASVAAWENIQKALKSPDEVYYSFDAESKTHIYNYYKWYNNGYLQYKMVLKNDLPLQLQNIQFNTDAEAADKARKGVLVYAH